MGVHEFTSCIHLPHREKNRNVENFQKKCNKKWAQIRKWDEEKQRKRKWEEEDKKRLRGEENEEKLEDGNDYKIEKRVGILLSNMKKF